MDGFDINTYKGLKDWFLQLELTPKMARSELCIARWEKALSSMTLGNLYSFYYCAGLTNEPAVLWERIRDEIQNKKL